jgi:hypothetical protein
VKKGCVSGKNSYHTPQLAEDVLIELWSRNEYNDGHAPIAIYKCDDCGDFHLTSRGPMNEALSEAIRSGKIKRMRDASQWESKFRRF